MKTLKLLWKDYWKVKLVGHQRYEVWYLDVLDGYESTQMSRTFLIEDGQKYAYSSGKWNDAENAIAAAKASMPKNWKGSVESIEKITVDFNEIQYWPEQLRKDDSAPG